MIMTNKKAVIIGFILTMIVKIYLTRYEFIGLLFVGLMTGYIAKSGIATVGGSALGLFGGLTGFTVSGISSLSVIIDDLIYYAIVMGITGAIGGLIASKK